VYYQEIFLDGKAANMVQIILTSLLSLGFRSQVPAPVGNAGTSVVTRVQAAGEIAIVFFR